MPVSSNISHWVCVVAGLYLALTGLLLRDALGEEPPSITAPPGSRFGRERIAGWGRRTVLIAVGLAAVAYGASRIL